MSENSWNGLGFSGVDDKASLSVTVDLDAKMRNGINAASHARITELSCEGMIMESDDELVVGNEVWVQFTIKDTPYAKRCEVVQIAEGSNMKHRCAMRFYDVNTRSQENLTKHLMQLQVQRARLAKGA